MSQETESMGESSGARPDCFECTEHCERRSNIIDSAGEQLNQTEWYKTQITLITLINRTVKMDKKLRKILETRGVHLDDGSVFTEGYGTEILSCRTSPESQDYCPLPASEKEQGSIADEAVAQMIAEGW